VLSDIYGGFGPYQHLITAINISREHMRQLTEQAEDGYPKEVCALLEGNIIGNRIDLSQTANVVGIIPMRNSDESVHTFRIDPSDLIRAYEVISARNLEVIGIFHSHSSEAFPSSTDMKYMEINPVVWLIYSTQSHSSAAFIHSDKVKKVVLNSPLQSGS
jgi:[CysO sulfur-carrier protein]-S-L-cysteine hydrolase